MMKGVALLTAGLVFGAATGWFVTKSLWDDDTKFRVEGYKELNGKYLDLRNSTDAAARMKETTANNSYDRQQIVGCMFQSTVRQNAIDMHLDDKAMSDIEKGIFQPMWRVASNSRDKSYQARRLALSVEANRLDNECLDSARILAS